MQIHSVRTPFIAFLALALTGALSHVLADQVVYFTNGKAMMVKTVEKADGVTILGLEGGGHLGVPTDQILRIEEYAVSRPDGARPAAPPPRAAAQPPATPGITPPQAGGSVAVGGAAVNEAADLVADAPSVVPDESGNLPTGLAAPRSAAQGVGVASMPAQAQDAGRLSPGTAAAATLAAQQSNAARMEQRQRAGQLNTPGGRTGRGGMPRGQALMGGQSPRRPGQGQVQDRNQNAVPPAEGVKEEIVPTAAERRGGKRGDTSGEATPPPSEDGSAEQTPSKAN